MRPLARFTFGRVSNLGWIILAESIRLFRKVYPEFDIVVCHNNLTAAEEAALCDIHQVLVKQDDLPSAHGFVDVDDDMVRNFHWKLVPPRLNQSGHELWIDNDLIIRDRITGIDKWLSKQTSVISTGFHLDYGRFTKNVHRAETYCAGLFGLPPGFDFAAKITELCGGKSLRGYDEQGLVVKVATDIKGFISIPQHELTLYAEKWKMSGRFNLPNGMHFARANRFENHLSWKTYQWVISP